MKASFLLSCISLLIVIIKSEKISPRAGSRCVCSSNKIFCYGGKPDNANYDNSIYLLDLNNIDRGPVTDLMKKWTEITVGQSSSVPRNEYRYDSQFVALPNGSMIFDGGYNEGDLLKAKTVIFDIESYTWNILPNFEDAKNGGYRQTYSGTATYLPATKRIAFYGGKTLNAALNSNFTTNSRQLSNLTYEIIADQDPTKKLIASSVGYYYQTFFNLNTNTWTTTTVDPFPPNGSPLLTSYQTSTFHPRTQTIIYIGGYSLDDALKGSTVPLDSYIAFNTGSTTWKVQNLTGVSIPGPRYLHTATLLQTEDDILVYGGAFQPKNASLPAEIVRDYIYTLDLTKFSWTAHNKLPEPMGPRANHSAVLVNDTRLFIMFGKRRSATNTSFVATDSILVLNVKDRAAPVFLDNYPHPSGEDDSFSSGLAGGAIAGIITIIAFVLYRIKRKGKEENLKEMHVDWDGIDNGYREDPPVVTGFSLGSGSPTTTAVPPIYVPYDAENVAEKPNETSQAHSSVLNNDHLIKPDVYEDIPRKTKPDNDNNNRSIGGLL
ncbi:hypothetical protein INT47_009121 [Mucor saturninus]|uniref:Galactose oxidase n=1 Tax=Mucor saturninus TaxID=64648 RepID=A0A8H7RNK9_9FUNG|nr:hypothetical protein INT47_009121 [Mucor saturninus]